MLKDDAALLHSRIALARGDGDAAAAAATRLLQAEPGSLLEIEPDPAFEAVLARPDMQAIIREARRKRG